MNSPIFYDLTELYLRSHGKIKYYGIARVVAEQAYEIAQLDPNVRYVVFDSIRNRFFELAPKFGVASDNGLVNLGLPDRGIPLRVREARPDSSIGSKAFKYCVRQIARVANAVMFPDIRSYMTPVDIRDGDLITAARPKFAGDIADFLVRTGSATRLHVQIYDMIPLHDPNWSRFKSNFEFDNKRILRRAHQAISISHYTDKELNWAIETGQLPKPKSQSVVQLVHECREDGETADIVLPREPYFLGVGITMGRKNFDLVLAALDSLTKQGKKAPLFVVAGVDRNRNRNALSTGQYAHLESRVQFEAAPKQANLVQLYRNALATVIPSKLEGWGLPLGESLWFGTPGISAPLSSLPEVGRDLAVYVDPDNPEQLAATFERFIDDTAYRAQLRQRIADAHGSLRTWRDVAEDLLQAIRRLENSAEHAITASSLNS